MPSIHTTIDSEIRRRLGERKYRRLCLLLKWTHHALEELRDIEIAIADDGGSTARDPLHGLHDDVRSALESIIGSLRDDSKPPTPVKPRTHLKMVKR